MTDNTRKSSIQKLIRVRSSEVGITLWRNNSGVLPNPRGAPVRFGLGNDSAHLNSMMKSSDLIGIAWPSGKFVAIETKPSDWDGWKRFLVPAPGGWYRGEDITREQAQWNFHEFVRTRGGIAGFATCWEHVQQLFEGRL